MVFSCNFFLCINVEKKLIVISVVVETHMSSGCFNFPEKIGMTSIFASLSAVSFNEVELYALKSESTCKTVKCAQQIRS